MWMRIGLLAFGAFAIGTDGFIVAGVLREVAGHLHVSLAEAGQLVTVFALVYAISSPLVTSLTSAWSRRCLLLSALAVFIIGNALAAFANSYPTLVAARVIAAVASAAYTPCASISAATLAGPKRRGRALSMVMGGITVATVIGVPIGTWLGHLGGYRVAFCFITGLGVCAFAGLALWLPPLPKPPTTTVNERVQSLRLPGIASKLLITLLAMSAGFTVYIYIGPMLAETMHADTNSLAWVLVVFGLAGALGNAASGWLIDHWGAARAIALSLSIVSVTLALLPVVTTTFFGTLTGVFVWNAAAWLLLPAQQSRLLSQAPSVGHILVSLNASAMYLGIGAGGLLGGIIVTNWTAQALGPAAAGVAATALLLHIRLMRQSHP